MSKAAFVRLQSSNVRDLGFSLGGYDYFMIGSPLGKTPRNAEAKVYWRLGRVCAGGVGARIIEDRGKRAWGPSGSTGVGIHFPAESQEQRVRPASWKGGTRPKKLLRCGMWASHTPCVAATKDAYRQRRN